MGCLARTITVTRWLLRRRLLTGTLTTELLVRTITATRTLRLSLRMITATRTLRLSLRMITATHTLRPSLRLRTATLMEESCVSTIMAMHTPVTQLLPMTS